MGAGSDLHQADDVPLRIGEQRDRGLGRDLGERHDDAATIGLHLGQGALRILGPDVEGDVPRTAVGSSADAGGQVLLAEHAVAARVVGVEAPAEDVAVELLQLLAILAHHFDVDDLVSHRCIAPSTVWSARFVCRRYPCDERNGPISTPRAVPRGQRRGRPSRSVSSAAASWYRGSATMSRQAPSASGDELTRQSVWSGRWWSNQTTASTAGYRS